MFLSRWKSAAGLPVLSALLAVVAFWGPGCKKPNPWKLSSPRDLAAPDGKPSISKVEDIGTVSILKGRPLKSAGSDGVAVPGELLVIRGKNLGRLPGVGFGKKAVDILARLEDGGVVIRVPKGVQPGPMVISVTTRQGTGTKKIDVRRYGLASVVGLESTSVLHVEAQGVKVTGDKLALGKVVGMATHQGGAVAYVASSSGKLATIDFAAKGGPSVVGRQDIPKGGVQDLAVASHAHRMVTLGRETLTLWDTENPKAPTPWDAVTIPKELAAKRVLDVGLSPDGKTLALLLADLNGFVLADVTDVASVRWGKPQVIHTGEDRPRLVMQLKFLHEDVSQTASEQSLWVLSGDNASSLQVGREPVSAARYLVESAKSGVDLPVAKEANKFTMPDTMPPVDWSQTFNPRQIQSGASLRQDPSRMVFFVATVDSGLYDLPRPVDRPTGHQALLTLYDKVPGFSYLKEVDSKGRLKSDLKLDQGLVLGSVAATTDGGVLLAVACKGEKATGTKDPAMALQCGVFSMEIGKNTSRFVPLTKPSINVLVPPFALGRLVVQP